jgi:tetratricopeptide (TPR) repeat protein/transcriptional regulator with XRE-family HTH domain
MVVESSGPISFGEHLRRLRVAAGLTQEALAERSGVSVDAISALENGRRLRPRGDTLLMLMDGMGLGPGDRELLVAAAATRRRPRPAPEARTVVPRELPRPPADFTGRTAELAVLRDLLGQAARARAGEGRPLVIGAIDGMAGIGKSALAIQIANQLADLGTFPDGQLYVNLQGATPGLPPLPPLDALGRMLRSLGMDAAAIPTVVDEAAARFRSVAAERRLLVVLDNARSSEQVRPLLPGSPTCGVLVTSRQVLSTLEGIHALHLDVLARHEARQLLRQIAGRGRIDAEPEAAAEVARWCGRLPLALRIAGGRLVARPGWSVRELADQLADATQRLEALQADGLAVRASFEVSLHALRESSDPIDRAAGKAFALLSVPDGPDLGVEMAARLLGCAEPTVHAMLERLVDAQLLEASRPERYRFHDLVGLYAREHAAPRPTGSERLAAIARLVGHATAVAWYALARLRPGSHRLAAADPRWVGGVAFGSPSEALDWLEAERASILALFIQAAHAVLDGAPEIPARLPGQLAQALFGFFIVRGYWHDAASVNRMALELAQRLGDRAAEASACNDLGLACGRLGRYALAIDHLRESAAIARELGDHEGRAAVLSNLSQAYREAGRYEEAIASLQEGVADLRGAGERQRNAGSLMNFGTVYAQLGRNEEAITCLQESLDIFRETGDRQGQAHSLTHMGRAYERLGQYENAIACQQNSLDICRELGDRRGQAASLNILGVVLGRLVRNEDAIARLQESLAIFRELGDRRYQAAALRDLGDVLRATGRTRQARSAWREGLAIGDALRTPEADEIRARLAVR